MGFLRLRTKMAIMLTLLVALPSGFLGHLALQEQEKLVQKTVREVNAALTAMLASHIFRLVDATRKQLEILCGIPEMRSLAPEAVAVVLDEALRNNELLEGAVVWDEARRMVGQRSWSAPSPGGAVQGETARRFFSEALMDRYGQSSSRSEVGVGGRSPTVMSAMIYGPDETIQGVLQARLSGKHVRRTLDALLDQVKQAYGDLDVYVVTEEDDEILLASRGAQFAEERYLPVDEVTDRAGFNPAVPLRKFQPYQTPNWNIWVVPRPSALDSARQVARTVRSTILVAVGIALFVGMLFVASVTRPVGELARAALAISRGELHRPVLVKASDEIGELAESFELMRQNLVRMQGSLRDRIEELQVLYGVARAVSSTLDLSELLHTILDRLMAVMKAERGSIMLYDEERDELRVEVARGIEPALTREARVKMGERVSGYVLQTGRPLLVQDTEASPNLARLKDGDVASGTLLSVPLIHKEKRLGVLNVSKTTAFTFDEKDQELFTALANQAAIAIQNARLYTLAITDELTRLYIRRFFYQRLREEMRRSSRYGKPCSVLVMDVDHFKKFNDTYGHQAGDEVLQFVARTMRECVRNIDIVARLGGEEFAVLCPEQSEDEAAIPAERIRERLASTRLKLSSGTEVGVTTSIGIAMFPRDGETQESLVDAADQALYEAKRTGRNRVCFFRDISGSGPTRDPGTSGPPPP